MLRLQASSTGYTEWLGAENDIYDEVFSDEIKKIWKTEKTKYRISPIRKI